MHKIVFQVVQMFIGLGLLIWAFYPRTPAAATSTATARDRILACDMKVKHEQCVVDASGGHHPAELSDNRRIIAIGDVHGAYKGLLEVLHAAKITTSPDECEWKDQGSNGVVLVQQGDLVDRGPQAWETLLCLRHLQKEAPKYNSKVVRLIGNHELWWLNGHFHHRNPAADTRERIIDTILAIANDISVGTLQAAYVHTRYEVPILFIHAGVRPQYHDYLKHQAHPERKGDATELTATEIADLTNGILKGYIAKCNGYYPCAESSDEFFEAGPDRGGASIGGPLWTDFRVLEKADLQNKAPLGFIQVVGHTMAFCYNPGQPGVHPPHSEAECAQGLVRGSKHLQAVCVDAGMYVGARAYLEIGEDAHFRAYQRYRGDPHSVGYDTYQVHDLTEAVCKPAAI